MGFVSDCEELGYGRGGWVFVERVLLTAEMDVEFLVEI